MREAAARLEARSWAPQLSFSVGVFVAQISSSASATMTISVPTVARATTASGLPGPGRVS